MSWKGLGTQPGIRDRWDTIPTTVSVTKVASSLEGGERNYTELTLFATDLALVARRDDVFMWVFVDEKRPLLLLSVENGSEACLYFLGIDGGAEFISCDRQQGGLPISCELT